MTPAGTTRLQQTVTVDALRFDSQPRLEQVEEGIHELRLPIPWEEGLVNCYLFAEGEDVDLLDCGIQSEESVEAVRQAIRSVGGRRLRRLVITHIHPDHFGAAGILKRETGAEVFMHRLEVPMVHPRYLELEQLVTEVGRHLRANGVPDDVADTLQNASRSLREFVTPAEPDVQLDGAETIEVGGRPMRVEWTPGHSPGHICLFEPARRLLFAGDQLLPDISPNIGLHPQSTPNPLGEFLDSLDGLAALAPARIFPAHGRPFTDARARVDQMKLHHQRRLERIEAMLGTDELSGWEIAIRLWGEREQIWDKRLALQEALAHLQLLAVRHRAEKIARAEQVRWRAAGSAASA